MIGRACAWAFVGLFLVATLIWPVAATVLEAGGDELVEPAGTGLVVPMTEDASIRPLRLAWTTVKLVGMVEAAALPTGALLAFVLFRTDVPARRGLRIVVGLLAAIPLPLYATAWLGAFGNLGRAELFGGLPVLVGLFGAAVVHALAALPWVVLIVGAGMRTVERELEDAARLELPWWRAAWATTFRRSVGHVAGAAVAVAVLTAGDMTITDLLSVRTYAEEAYLQFQIGRGPAAAAAVAIPPLLVLAPLLLLTGRTLLRIDPARRASVAIEPDDWRLGRGRAPVGGIVVAAVVLLAGIPIHSLVWRAGRVGGDAARGEPPRWSAAGLAGSLDEAVKAVWPPSYRARGGSPARIASSLLRKPIVASLVWSAAAATLATAFAWTLAWRARRGAAGRGTALLAGSAALALPGPVVGMGFYLAYRSIPPISNTGCIVALACAARVWPYAALVLWPALRGVPEAYLDAAALDGRSGLGLLRRVVLPIAAGATALAWTAAFLLSFGELPATGLVAPPGLTTMPILIWGALHIGVESRLAAVSLLNLAVFGLLLAAAAVFFRVKARGSRTP